jgi:hypothetical protein
MSGEAGAVRGSEPTPRVVGAQHGRLDVVPTKNAVGGDLAAVVDLDHEDAELWGIAFERLEVISDLELGRVSGSWRTSFNCSWEISTDLLELSQARNANRSDAFPKTMPMISAAFTP